MKNKVCIVRPSLAHVLRLSRIAGVAPLNFEQVRNGFKISISQKWAIYSYILITLLSKFFVMKIKLYNYIVNCKGARFACKSDGLWV